MRSRSGSFSSNLSQQQLQQQQHGSSYSSQPPTPTTREGFYSGVGLNIHTTGYGSGGYNNNKTGYGSGPSSPVSMSPYATAAQVPGGGGASTPTPTTPLHPQSHQLPASSRRSGGGAGSGVDDGGYSSGYDSSSGISTSVPYVFNTNGLHRPHPQHPQQQQQQHGATYQQHQTTTSTTRQSTQRYYPRSHNRNLSNASETSLNIDTGADTTLYSSGPASLSSASSSRRGSFSDANGIGTTSNGTGYFARQRTYRPPTAGAVSDADDDLDMDLGNKNSPRRLRQKRMTKKSASNRGLLGAVGGMGGGKSGGRGMSGILNDWDMLLPSGDPYEDVDENEDDDGMNENERWKKKQLARRGWESKRGQGIILGLIVTVAVFVRIWKLAVPAAVMSEEQHLGGYIRDYLQGNFVVDVHPPLGKMLFSLVAYLLGYDGKFDFMSGNNVPFIGMRMFAAACGVGLIPISYLIIKRSGHSTQAAITCAILVTFVTIGLCVLKYLQESRKHLYLSTSGLGDSWVSPQFRMTLKGHDVELVMADIAWQSKIHMRHANSNGGWVHSTPGEYARDGTIDQAIQLVEWDDELTCWQVEPSDLATKERQSQNYIDRAKNAKSDNLPPFEGYIYDGNLIRLKHCYTKVALSAHTVESIGSNKSHIQEVRGIPWTREPSQETIWRVELVPDGAVPGLWTRTAKQPLKAGEVVKERWHSIKGFRLWNEQRSCYLMSHKVYRTTYSSYQEVGCIRDGRQKGDTIFVVDRNVNLHLPAATPSHSYEPLSFLQKFIEINKVMWWTRHDLASPLHSNSHSPSHKSRKSDASQPWSWLFLGRGLNYYSSKETNNYVYLLGNPVVWWAASSIAVLYVLGCFWSVFGFLRGKAAKDQQNQPRARFGLTPFYTIAPGTFCLGWFVHYAPYFFISSSSPTTLGSQLYLHNYLPSLYFSILLLVSRLDRTWQSWSSRKLRYTTGLILVILVILSWYSLSPLAYGTDFSSRQACEQARSVGGWEFVCRRQNLPLARPQDAIAKIVVERRMDHEEHEEQEEAENSQLYYQTPPVTDSAGAEYHDHGHDHDHAGHDHDGEGGEGEEHDHEGPFNEDEREHYDHEHFHHPSGHQHPDDHGHYHHRYHDDHPHQDTPPSSLSSPDAQAEADKKLSAKQGRMDKMFAAAAQNANNALLQREKLVAEKLALQDRQRELDEQLRVQEEQERQQQVEVERQKEVEKQKEREKEERQAAAAAHEEQVQKDREVRKQVRRAQEERERERQAQEEKVREEQERLQHEEQEHQQREAQEQLERQQRQEQEQRDREGRERQQREAQEQLERQQRQEQEQRDREDRERQQREAQEQQERQQREEQNQRNREARKLQQREEQERQQREKQLRRDREAQELHQQQQLLQQEREQLERQAAEKTAAAMQKEKKEEEARKEKMTRQMLEEQVRILQAQVDSHHARSLGMAAQQQQLQQQQQQHPA
ncbi:hypothetical protein KI688_003421 [Linnemannia hyalina]|uniref:dolichyl-phosphate-mannose--protein mannosyltransferase n=1 Tax=Linnemannia hyalina TaxID=64524 RepID=A0A9P7XPF8_9FUNG|nr:hypothetical protein KI688_003421 [Linnemannia hyalina]